MVDVLFVGGAFELDEEVVDPDGEADWSGLVLVQALGESAFVVAVCG